MFKKERSIDSFVYIKFPFRMADYNGFKELQLYHHKLNHKHNRRNSDMAIRMWGYFGINIKKIKEFFSQSKLEHEKLLVELRGHLPLEYQVSLNILLSAGCVSTFRTCVQVYLEILRYLFCFLPSFHVL